MDPTEDPSDEELGRHVKQAFALQDAPADWVRRAIDLWQPRAAPLREPLRRLRAILAVDSWALNAGVLAVRGGSPPARHLLFRAEEHDIDVRISEAEHGFAIAGQVLGPEEAGEIEVSGGPAGGTPRVALLDDFGEFRVGPLTAGRYSLVLRLGADDIDLPPIEVGRRGG